MIPNSEEDHRRHEESQLGGSDALEPEAELLSPSTPVCRTGSLWPFVWRWGCASFVWVLVIPITLFVIAILKGTASDTFDPPRPESEFHFGGVIVIVIASCIVGSVVGAIQKSALRHRGISVKRWVAATAFGFAAGLLWLAFPVYPGWSDDSSHSVVIVGGLIGFSVGTAQWIAARRVLPQAWLISFVTCVSAVASVAIISRSSGSSVSALGGLLALILYPTTSGLVVVGLSDRRANSLTMIPNSTNSARWRLAVEFGLVALIPLIIGIAPQISGARGSWNRYLQQHELAMPAHVTGLPPIATISAAGDHSFAVAIDGSFWGWGGNRSAELGFIGPNVQLTPARVPNLPPLSAIAASSTHAVALAEDGTVWTWGSNLGKELGDTLHPTCVPEASSDGRCLHLPDQVSSLRGVAAVAAGDRLSAALLTDGTVWVWGWVADETEFITCDGQPLERFSSIPIHIASLDGAVQIDAAFRWIVARKADGSVWTWDSRVGRPAESIPSLNNATDIDARGRTAITSDGSLWRLPVAGCNNLVSGSSTWRAAEPATALDGPDNARLIRQSISGVTFVSTDDRLYSWGSAENGQLGTSPSATCYSYESSSDTAWWEPYPCTENPTALAELKQPIAVSVADNHVIALTADHVVWSWGFTRDGRLGR